MAYEQSAYLICIDKAYKPKKKWIKYLEKEVVTVGFPPIALEFWQKENQVTCIEEKENFKIFGAKNKCITADFLSWKESIVLLKSINVKSIQTLEQKILHFPLANSTPVEAFMFLGKLQKEISPSLKQEN